ncbi:MAG: DUF998 domain-containing protein [Candidatus Thorarchaeota archaeon]
MDFDKSTMGNALLFIGSVQWFFGLLLAESWFPGYSSTIDYVSDLGTGPTAIIYNASVFLMGFCLVAGSYFLYDDFKSRPFTLFLILTGIGCIGLGLFPANMQPMHSFATLTAILFGAFSAIASFRVQRPPLSYVSVILGLVTLGAVVLFMPYLGLEVGSTETFLGIAKGSMERWAIYPLLAWMIIFASSRIGTTNEASN